MPQYEIHLTVDPADLENAVKALEHDIFAVKGLQFQNWTRKGVAMDAMTSTRCTKPSGKEARIYAELQAETLRTEGIAVLRVKVETDPFHEEDPSSICVSTYYETHFPIIGGNGWVPNSGLHSRNLIKRNEWITIRERDGEPSSFQQHHDRCSRFVGSLVFQGFCLTGKPHHEWVLLDSNREHDKDWEG